jgi:hypothetical protein
MVLYTTRNDAMADVNAPMRALWGDIAPRLTEISDTVLFDDVWRRPGLSPRDSQPYHRRQSDCSLSEQRVQVPSWDSA